MPSLILFPLLILPLVWLSSLRLPSVSFGATLIVALCGIPPNKNEIMSNFAHLLARLMLFWSHPLRHKGYEPIRLCVCVQLCRVEKDSSSKLCQLTRCMGVHTEGSFLKRRLFPPHYTHISTPPHSHNHVPRSWKTSPPPPRHTHTLIRVWLKCSRTMVLNLFSVM